MSRRRSQSGAAEAEAREGKAALEEAEHAIAVLLAVSRALAAWDSFGDGSERLLGALAEAMGLTAGALWLPQEHALVLRAVWSAPPIDREALTRGLQELRLSRGVGVAGCAWEHREPIDRERATTEIRVPRGEATLAELRAVVGLPALADEQVLGVLELYSASRVELGPRLMHVLNDVGQIVGTFFARRYWELRPSPLTARELEVLTLAAEGLARPKIAEQLSISSATVKTHLEHIYKKLEVSDRTAAAAKALRAGLIA